MSGKENLDGRRNGSAPGELVLELELLFSSLSWRLCYIVELALVLGSFNCDRALGRD